MVGISLLTLVPGVVGGSETYARALARALARVGELEYRAFVPAIAADAADGLPSTTVTAYRAGRSMPARIAAMTLASVAPRAVLRGLELDRLDAIHFPLTIMLPRVDRPPAATTVMDIQHEIYPRFFSRAELAYRRLVYGWTFRKSRLLIAPSAFVADTFAERLGVDRARVRVIPLAIDHELFRPGTEPREPFILYPANRWPHKNHERLFEALELLRRDRPELRLVLTGSGHEGHPAPPGVDVRGRVSNEELVSLYRRASGLVFPSLYEGFGAPPLEAMACGCPVAASRIASLPEVCGGAAILFDPHSPEEIAAAAARLLDDGGELARRGLERARGFTWDAAARAHEAVYRELAAG